MTKPLPTALPDIAGLKITARQFAAIRAKLRLSQEKLAARLGVHWRTVNRWEKGESRISLERALDIRKVAAREGVRV